MILVLFIGFLSCNTQHASEFELRQRVSLNADWQFFKYDSDLATDQLIYDVLPEVTENVDSKDADSKPTEAEVKLETKIFALNKVVKTTETREILNRLHLMKETRSMERPW